MSSSPSEDPFSDLKSGEHRTLVEEGHEFHISYTGLQGWHTRQRQYQVRCVTCDIIVAPLTIRPKEWSHTHVLNRCKRCRGPLPTIGHGTTLISWTTPILCRECSALLE